MNSLDYLLSFQRFGIKLGLDNISYLLHRMGDPHCTFPAIHITGTNGKGSVTAFIHSVLIEMGFSVGRYISPHLLDFSERIVVNKEPITAQEIDSLVDQLRPIVADMENEARLGHPTFFEAVTAMAFQHFANRKVDFAVVEVGMGGRYDSTNVVLPCLSIITNVHLEHCDYLGDTLEKIAVEKAGIIKPGVEVVSAAEQPEVRIILDTRSKECESDIFYLSRDFECAARRGEFPRQYVDFNSSALSLKIENVEINLAGRFQARNAAVALMALGLLARKGLIRFDEDAIRRGMAATAWPARLEKLGDSPLMLLDSAHNPSAMNALTESMREWFHGRRVLVVLGMLADKDVPQCLKILRGLTETLVVTEPRYERAMNVERLARLAQDVFAQVRSEPTIADALRRALALAKADDIILVTGSLFNVAEVRQFMIHTEETRPYA
ncbi:MAG: folylpolyglutamate synthase/dihydrofolate synthase family protein [Candidatus Abyssubacteria bacterium]